MKHFIGSARNIIRTQAPGDTWQSEAEVILLATEPSYTYDAGGLRKDRTALEPTRLVFTARGARSLSETLAEIADELEALGKNAGDEYDPEKDDA